MKERQEKKKGDDSRRKKKEIKVEEKWIPFILFGLNVIGKGKKKSMGNMIWIREVNKRNYHALIRSISII